MNRRLFAGQLVAGVSLLGVPASLLAQSVSTPSRALGSVVSSLTAAGWIQSGALGALQQVTLSHAYCPGRTSASALMALLEQDLAKLTELLGLERPLVAPGFSALSAAGFGTYSAQLEQGGVSISWQALARIGAAAKDPLTCLVLLGSKGLVQSSPATNGGYALIDLKTQRSEQVTTVSGASPRLNRRSFFTL